MIPSTAGAQSMVRQARPLPEFSDMLILSLIRGVDYFHPLALPHENFSVFMLPYGKGAFLISRSAVETADAFGI